MASFLLDTMFNQSTNSEFLRTVYRNKCRELELSNQQIKEQAESHKKELAVLHEERGVLKAEIESLKLKAKPKQDEALSCWVSLFLVLIIFGAFSGKKA